jgi:hypothetical protein
MRLKPRFAWVFAGASAFVAVAPAKAATPSGNVSYYGGHVISHVQVLPVMWGTTVSPDVVSGAEGFFTTIVNSPYMDWLGEYDTAGLNGKLDSLPGSNQHVNRGTVLPTITITPINTSTSLSNADIQTELLAQLKAGKLPAPKIDAEGGVDTVYVFAFPAGMTITDFSGSDICGGGCAYHWEVTVPGVASGVPFAVIPNCSGSSNGSGCSLGTVFQTFTGDCSHELVEAMTDTECSSLTTARPLAWFDPAQANGEGEVGDICLSETPTPFVTYLGYTVQQIWSQRLKKCITNDPSLKLCDGKTRPCTPCVPSDCSGATPICNQDMSSSTWGQCVSSVPDAGSSGGSTTDDGGTSSGASSSSSGGGVGGGGSGGSSGGGSSGGSSGDDASAGNGDNGGTGSGSSSSGGGGGGSSPGGGGGGGCALASAGAPAGSSLVFWAAGLLGLVRARGRRRASTHK